jgi:hypothetical protein
MKTASGLASNGGRSLQNNFLLDGIDNNSNLPDLLNETNYVIQPSVEALQEFKVQTNAYSAEFGRGNGAIVNVAVMLGKNALVAHGSLSVTKNSTLETFSMILLRARRHISKTNLALSWADRCGRIAHSSLSITRACA